MESNSRGAQPITLATALRWVLLYLAAAVVAAVIDSALSFSLLL